jgi:hypothetical protein
MDLIFWVLSDRLNNNGEVISKEFLFLLDFLIIDLYVGVIFGFEVS